MKFSAAMPGWGEEMPSQTWMRQWQALFAPWAQTPWMQTPWPRTPWAGMAAGMMPGVMPMSAAMPGMGAPGGHAASTPMDVWQALFSGFNQMANEGLAQARQAAATMAASASAGRTPRPGMAALWPDWHAQEGLPDAEAALREALDEVPVGPLREHVERWQHALRAQLDYQQAAAEFGAMLNQIAQQALACFEQRLAARAEAGEPIQTPRALFDEWIEAGEAVWGEYANSEAFMTTFGRYGNAELRLRAALQDQLNRTVEAMGLPTRSEVDADHRRIAQLERALHRVQAQLAQVQRGAAQPADTAAADGSAAADGPPSATATRPRAVRAAATPSKTKASRLPSRRAGANSVKPPGPQTANPDSKRASTKTAEAGRREASSQSRRGTPRLARRKARRAESVQASVNILPHVAPPRAFGINAEGGKNGKRKKQGARA